MSRQSRLSALRQLIAAHHLTASAVANAQNEAMSSPGEMSVAGAGKRPAEGASMGRWQPRFNIALGSGGP